MLLLAFWGSRKIHGSRWPVGPTSSKKQKKPNWRSLLSYHTISHIISYHIISYHIIYHIISYYSVLYYIVLYYIILYCIILYYIILYCIVLYCIILYCIILYYIVLYCIISYYIIAISYYSISHHPHQPVEDKTPLVGDLFLSGIPATENLTNHRGSTWYFVVSGWWFGHQVPPAMLVLHLPIAWYIYHKHS